MKYGLLIDFGLENCNYGDYAQTIAIEYLYGLMGIPASEIVHISYDDLKTYRGERLLLPYSYVLGYIMDRATNRVRLSEWITPVFLGASIGVGFTKPLDLFSNPENGWLELFRKFAPIGCRDEATRAFLQSLNIPAYLQGCITSIFPQRENGEYKKTLLVDCPVGILPYIPDAFMENVEVLSNAQDIGDLTLEENYTKIKRRYQYYRDHAALIVTSRYHVATPCSAMGIPVVLTMRPYSGKAKDIRLDSLNPAVQLCSAADYDRIDWNLQPADTERLKSNVIALAAARIHESAELLVCTSGIRSSYESRIADYAQLEPNENELLEQLRSFVREYHTAHSGKFYIWAASELLCTENDVPLKSAVNEVAPGLMFAGWLDSYKRGTLAGKPIYAPDAVELGEHDFVIVATATVIPFAEKLFSERKLEKKHYMIFQSQMISNEDLKAEMATRTAKR